MKNVRYPEFSSFLISLFLAIFILCVIGYRLNISSLQAIKYTDDKEAVVDIYFEEEGEENSKPEKSIEEKPIEKQISKPEPKKTEIPKKEPKEVIKEEPKNELVEKPKETLEAKPVEHNQTQSKPQQTDELVLTDLFDSDVKSTVENNKNKASDSQSSSNSNKGKSQRTGVYNEFIGGVEKKLERIWRSYNANPGYSAIVEIRITKEGRAYVDIVKIPYDTMFNQKVRDFADRIENETFPRPPGGEFTQEYKLTDRLKEN